MDAYDEGIEAFENGAWISESVYEENSLEDVEFKAGWSDAEKAFEGAYSF